MIQDFPPGRVFGGAAPVALIDHNQIEESRGELPVELLTVFWTGNRLIKTQVDLVCRVDAALLVDSGGELDLGTVIPLDGLTAGAELRHGGSEGSEIVHHGLIDQDIAIC